MRRFVVSAFLIAGVLSVANAAPRPVTRNAGGLDGGSTQQARAATSVAARAATTQPKAVSARAATSQPKTISARAATTTQKVINFGTKITGAAKNIVVNEECQNKYFGCMDAFCMIDNANGGRCLCSDRNAELDTVLAEIEKLDQQSYQMATFGVEQIEMGENADAAIAKANAVADNAVNGGQSTKRKARAALDLSMWNNPVYLDEEDLFGASQVSDYGVEGKTGDTLHNAASELCAAEMPECYNEKSMLQLLYTQRIKSDCAAYENSLKQQKNASQTKLATAQKALREAALEQLQNSNKYDLGQCAIQFKKCMQTTGGCGEDFSGCAFVAAMDNTNVNKSSSKKAKNYEIQGAISTIEISATTYDTLLGKKPLCESVTKSCTLVADQVWDTFLRDVAPSIKTAEIVAEDNARQNCIGTIASCFQKACKDTIDPDDPEGSYDMCLTRPGSLLNVCKIPLNACGIDATSQAKAERSDIWNYVVARLASMRVDSCTKAVKSCLQSADRCGKDYTQCVGLDTNTIIEMCPTDKLVACQDNGAKKSIADLSNLVLGILLDIDNNMLTQCQNAITTKMLELCGDTESCVAFDSDADMGTESLMSYKDSEGNFVIEGLVSFGNLKISETSNMSNPDDVKFGKYEVNISDYRSHLNDSNATTQRIISSLQSVANKINQKIALLSEDSTIKTCIEGRDMSQIRSRSDTDASANRTTARYPNLLDSSIMAIVNSGIEHANKNYTKKYNKLVGEAMQSQNEEMKSMLCASMASKSPECVEYATMDDGEEVCTKYQVNNFDGLFTNASTLNSDSGPSDAYATRYVISGASLSKMASAQQSGHASFVQTDSFGNMLGNISMSAFYSPSEKTCTITTESTMCKETQAVITKNRIKRSGVFYLIGRKNYLEQVYHGAMCKEFGEPVTTTNVIEM